jgi:hypothetical protein
VHRNFARALGARPGYASLPACSWQKDRFLFNEPLAESRLEAMRTQRHLISVAWDTYKELALKTRISEKIFFINAGLL